MRNYFLKNNRKKSSLGFTLIEIIVSMAIFSIVMLIATGSIFSIVDANKKTHALKSVMTNLNFALEGMMRDIRTGYDFSCVVSGTPVGDCSSGSNAFQFVSNADIDNNGSNDTILYSFSGGTIYRNNNGIDPGPVAITAPEVNITTMKFYVLGSNAADNAQPYVVITIGGNVALGGETSSFFIQTTVSQRLLD